MTMFSHERTQLRALAAARFALALAVLALVASLAIAGSQSAEAASSATGSASAKADASAGKRPSFVVIQTDDQTLDALYASFTPLGGAGIPAMPNTLSLIANRGVTLNRYYVPYPLCCPSRVSLLTGRYAHNHNVRGNVQPEGGASGLAVRQGFSHNLATWLQGAGYRTIHVGKYLNGYGDEPYDTGTVVPPGWDAWHSVLKSDTNHYFYGYQLNNNGSIDGPFGDSGSWDTREYGEVDDFGCPSAPLNGLPCFYLSDMLSRIASEELVGTGPERPFYLQLDYTAPHGDFRRPAGPEPAPRHYDTFAGAQLPHDRAQGVNEGNVADKPKFIREASYLSPSELHTYRVYYQKQLEALRAIDDGVKLVIDTLGFMQRLRNTYVIFTSDNGFFLGEHRLTGGKFLAYEASTHVPFLMRGPGIKPGGATGELAANVDIAPTILELAGVEADKSIDGRSLVPYLKDTSLRSRRPILFESFVETSDVVAHGGDPSATPAGATASRRAGATASIVAPPKDYQGIRLGPYKYIEWPNGEKELYDITKDPYELNNIARRKNFYPIRGFLHKYLEQLRECSGTSCRQPTPKLPLTLEQKRKREREKRERERREKEQKRNED